MMAYEPTEWKDHIVQHPNRYRITDRGDGTVDIVPEQGQVIQQGTPVDAQRLNKIEQGIKDAHDEIASHKAEYMQFKQKVEAELANYNQYASNKDENGVFTIVEYKRADGTLYMRSTLSNPDPNGNYQTNTWDFYDETGTTVIDTLVWTFTYDADGDIVSKVVA